MLTRRGSVAAQRWRRGCAAGAGDAAAQAYPTQTIRIIAGFPAGGGIDMLGAAPGRSAQGRARPAGDRREPHRRRRHDRGAARSPRRAPDGHTLLMATSGEIAISHHLYKEKMTYDPMKELAPMALVGIVPCVVVVAATTPVHTPQELIAYAKANPGKLSFSSSGVGNPQQLAGELMNIMAGTDVLHVPYRGAAPAVTDVATGAVTMSFTSLAAALRPDPGRQAARGRGHLARADAATARCRAAAGGRAGAEGLRIAQLVRRCSRPAARRRRSWSGSTRSPSRRSPSRRRSKTLDEQGIVPRADDAGAVQGLRRGRRAGSSPASSRRPTSSSRPDPGLTLKVFAVCGPPRHCRPAGRWLA